MTDSAGESNLVGQAAPIQPQEKLVPQSEVDKAIGATKQHAYAKGMEDAKKQLMANQAPAQPVPAQSPSAFGGAPLTHDEMNRMIIQRLEERDAQSKQAQQEQEKQQMQARAKQRADEIITSMEGKVQSAKTDHPDIEDVINKSNLGKVQHVLAYTDTVDNGGHVLYDLLKNKMKLGSLLALHPDDAIAAVKELSESLKVNKNADQMPQAPNPSGSNLTASHAGVGGGSEEELQKKAARRKYTY